MIYVNEIDQYCAQWLQNLMDAGVLPPGHIDTRSIEDVTPNDLAGYTQHHFFAGLGGWIYALDLAGWPRDRPVWTGSCPCQPFSAAGKGTGFADERHLWPAWQHLIAQRKPATVFGEQVASKAVDDWIDLVHADMEGLGYAFGSVSFPSAGVGAPHIRDRNYWLGHANGAGLEGHAGHGGAAGRQGSRGSVAKAGLFGGLADIASAGCEARGGHRVRDDEAAERPSPAPHDRSPFGLAHSTSLGRDGRRSSEASNEPSAVERLERLCDAGTRPGPTNGLWRDADWLLCRDGKWRPVEPGTFPLAHGIPGRVGRLRAYGNAINPHQAAEFVAAFMNADVRQELAAA